MPCQNRRNTKLRSTTEKREEREERSSEERTDGTEEGREREERGMQRRRREEAKHAILNHDHTCLLLAFSLSLGCLVGMRERVERGLQRGMRGMRE